MLNFFRQNKLIAALFLISFLMILLGVSLLQYSKWQMEQQSQAQAQLQTLNNIANEAHAQLLQTVAHPDVPITDVIPADSVAKVAAMEDKNPAPGTADWCEVMMVKPSREWTSDEQQTFAKHCI
jgi:predicted negative regulator of RcsB-dependent stress response